MTSTEGTQQLGPRIRVRSNGVFSDATVHLVQEDGTEIPLMDIVTAVTVRVASNELSTATVTFECVELDVTGHLQGSAHLG